MWPLLMLPDLTASIPILVTHRSSDSTAGRSESAAKRRTASSLQRYQSLSFVISERTRNRRITFSSCCIAAIRAFLTRATEIRESPNAHLSSIATGFNSPQEAQHEVENITRSTIGTKECVIKGIPADETKVA